jgi:hypothetical protein
MDKPCKIERRISGESGVDKITCSGEAKSIAITDF